MSGPFTLESFWRSRPWWCPQAAGGSMPGRYLVVCQYGQSSWRAQSLHTCSSTLPVSSRYAGRQSFFDRRAVHPSKSRTRSGSPYRGSISPAARISGSPVLRILVTVLLSAGAIFSRRRHTRRLTREHYYGDSQLALAGIKLVSINHVCDAMFLCRNGRSRNRVFPNGDNDANWLELDRCALASLGYEDCIQAGLYDSVASDSSHSLASWLPAVCQDIFIGAILDSPSAARDWGF